MSVEWFAPKYWMSFFLTEKVHIKSILCYVLTAAVLTVVLGYP
jgi:hypothetical protein